MDRPIHQSAQPHALRLRIHLIALDRGFTKSGLAKASGLSVTTISTLWNHPECDPRVSTLDKIAQVLEVTLEELIEHPMEKEPHRA